MQSKMAKNFELVWAGPVKVGGQNIWWGNLGSSILSFHIILAPEAQNKSSKYIKIIYIVRSYQAQHGSRRYLWQNSFSDVNQNMKPAIGIKISNFFYIGVKSDEKSENVVDFSEKLHLHPVFWKYMQLHYICKCAMRPDFTKSVHQTGGGL